jgi:Helix-turn-helix domain
MPTAQQEIAEKALQLKLSSTERPNYPVQEQEFEESDERRNPQRWATPPKHGPPLLKRGLSIEEFGQLYGICRSSSYLEIREGRLKARKVGRRTVIACEDAEAWFAALERVKTA